MANEQKNNSRFLKTLLIIFSSLILGMFFIGWYLNNHWNTLLKKELPAYVSAISDSLYDVRFQNLKLDVLSGSVLVEHLRMAPDTLVYQRLKGELRAPENLYVVEIDKLELKYFKLLKYFIGKKLSAGEIVVSGSRVEVEQNQTTIDTTAPKTAYQQITRSIKSLYIGNINLDSIAIKYVFIKKDSSRIIHQFRNLKMNINDLLIDSVALKDPTRFLYARNYEIGMKDYTHKSKDSLYTVYAKKIKYDAANRTFHIGQFQIEPRYDKDEFQKINGVQKDLYDIVFNDISIKELNPMLLLQEQQIWAERVDIGGGRFNIYRDRSLPEEPGNKLGKAPQQQLEKITIPFNFDTLVGNNVSIQYAEKNPATQQTGVINFRNIHGVFTNLTNIDSIIAQNNHLIANLDAIFMQSGKLRAKFDFILNDKTARFSVTGKLNNMNGKDLNVATKALAMLEIRSCDLQELDFNIKGDERKATGNMRLLYKNLRIAVLQQDKEHKEYKRRGLLSFVANIMVIKDSNPSPGDKERVATMNHNRDIHKSFFNLVWKTLFDGTKEIVGVANL
ncbi:hypothetical protein DVR12_11950 [Chitinophaga silvatica]|uniref:DUF748 domain-containing protein n=1 Tax=Chitinophaga silvatica TaxID=2282649 RepID=A0A3E1Y9X2_9BACT|nr:hypothetical protein [Chitinophaga silvatica]RFS22509.1 hypothetical protein DVR12_11950 [Chitinophaga silvatica]